MSARAPSFFIAGGTLKEGAPCYVTRDADQELYENLLSGNFCYLLTSRQVGKSSLMIRARARLREIGVRVAIIDLNEIGQNVTIDQWYCSLLDAVGSHLGLTKALRSFWTRHLGLSPMQRWARALREVASESFDTALAIFIDEIELTRRLPFPTDEFFGSIRSMYNGRTTDPCMERLAFCLIGSVAPADLVSNPTITPFNIGHRIDLRDFSLEEVAPLAEGISSNHKQGMALLARVLHWTGGHPYLTQRICLDLESRDRRRTPGTVDRLCKSRFFALGAPERRDDGHLGYMTKRLTASGVDVASAVDLYARIWRGERIRNSEANPLIPLLHLTGLVHERDGRLEVRNRIYRRCFDKKWIKEMRRGEEDRLRDALLRYARRASIPVIGILASLLILSAIGWSRSVRLAEEKAEEARRAEEARDDARRQAEVARREKSRADQNARLESKAKDDALAEKAKAEAEKERADRERARASKALGEARAAQRIATEQAVRSHSVLNFLAAYQFLDTDPTLSAAFLQMVERSDAVPRYDEVLERVFDAPVSLAIFGSAEVRLLSAAFRPAHREIALAYADGRLELRAETGRGRPTMLGRAQTAADSLRFSADGQQLAWSTWGGEVFLATLKGERAEVVRLPEPQTSPIAFGPQGRTFAAGSRGGGFRLWTLPEGAGAESAGAFLSAGNGPLLSELHIDPQRGRVVVAAMDGSLRSIPLDDDGKPIILLRRTSRCTALAVAPSGQRIAVGFADGTVQVLEGTTDGTILTLSGHTGAVTKLEFDRGDSRLLSLSSDGTVRIRTLTDTSRAIDVILTVATGPLTAATLLDNGLAVTGSEDGGVQVWDVDHALIVGTLRGHTGALTQVISHTTEPLLATVSLDGTTRVWSVPKSAVGPRPDETSQRHRDSHSDAARLAGLSTVCVPAPLRVTFLGETESDASHAFRACERSYGRSP